MRSSTSIGFILALVTIAGMLFNIISSAASPQGAPASITTSSPIDMQTDANGDHLPDALVAELQRLEAQYSHDLSEGVDKEALAAIAALSSRLPHAQSTRTAQAQAADLLAQLAAASDPAEQRALAQQVDQVLAQAEALDPTYHLAMATAAQLTGDKLGIQPDTGPDTESGTAQTIATGPDFSQLKRGDILLIRGGDIYLNWIYAQHYSHAGIYDGNGFVYESNPDGLRLKPLAEWQQPGHLVALGRNNRLSSEQVQAALDWAEMSYKTNGSTHYNHDIPDKWVADKLYCSQLVWRINQKAGVNLDSNDFWYLAWMAMRLGPPGVELAIPAVLPDEIALSDNITIYSAGITK